MGKKTLGVELILLVCPPPALGHLHPLSWPCVAGTFSGPSCLPSASGCHCHVQNCGAEHSDAAVKSYPFR